MLKWDERGKSNQGQTILKSNLECGKRDSIKNDKKAMQNASPFLLLGASLHLYFNDFIKLFHTQLLGNDMFILIQ